MAPVTPTPARPRTSLPPASPGSMSQLSHSVGEGNNLRSGSSGQSVTELQTRLSQLGYPVSADGRFGPNEPVTYAQAVSIVARALRAQGYWLDQPGHVQPYAEVPGAHEGDMRTFHFCTEASGGAPPVPAGAGWNDQATPGWFARALWTALASHLGVDGALPDGRLSGVYAP